MEIVFLLAGLALISIGIAIIVVEVRARQGTTPIRARVVGFSAGKSTNPNMSSFHTVAEYVGLNGHQYYVEASVGSSSPLHAIGDTVTVLSDPHKPERTVLKSSLSFVLGAVLALMGLVCVAVFRATFQTGIYSAVMAAIVIGGFALKIRSAWRNRPFHRRTGSSIERRSFPRRSSRTSPKTRSDGSIHYARRPRSKPTDKPTGLRFPSFLSSVLDCFS